MDDICLPNIQRKSARRSQNSNVVTDGAYTIKTASKQASVPEKIENSSHSPQITQDLSELWLNPETKQPTYKKSIQNTEKQRENEIKIISYDIYLIVAPEGYNSRRNTEEEVKSRFIFEEIYSEIPDMIAFQHIPVGCDQYSLIQGYQSIYMKFDDDRCMIDGCMISWKASKYEIIESFHFIDDKIFGIIGLLREKSDWTEYILFASYQLSNKQGIDIREVCYECTLRAVGNTLRKSEYKNIRIIIRGNYGIVMDRTEIAY